MKALSVCLVGEGHRQKMDSDETMLKRDDDLIAEKKQFEEERNLPSSERVISEGLLKTHEEQRKHFLGCLDLPDDCPWVVLDASNRQMVIRGTNQLENFWRHLRRACPGKAG